MNDLVRVRDGLRFKCERALGDGGQGTVWLATIDGPKVAVKVYSQRSATPQQRNQIDRLIQKGAPAPYFLWPEALVEDRASNTFGYVMALREPRFRSLEDLVSRRITPSFYSLLMACLQLADAFLELHAKGLCYRDISFGNIFMDPESGDIRVCDNDNVDIPGSAAASVLGTPKFMAPEVVRGEASPSDQTDRYSLAVLMFCLLFNGHPLDGEREARIKCMDLPALEALYGKDPVYIWHPTDGTNRPVPGIHDNPIAFRSLYPQGLMTLFERSFVEGLAYPQKRVRESEWKKALFSAMDTLHSCRCGAEGVARLDKCWACKRPIGQPVLLVIDGRRVPVFLGRRLLGYQIGAMDDLDIVGEVVANPQNPALIGLKNLTSTSWTVSSAGGQVNEVPPNRSALLQVGSTLSFGRARGEVVAA